jgi:alkanesulfonate monooxygenase SsuD/methylene tetrahydromethanopterin reductase-like flavin-dependent oxidoreductase (luciferase family)
LQIVRQLLATGQCEHRGKHYQVDIAGDNRLALVTEQPPPLIASAGGPRALREVTPLVDRVEIKASARSTRMGQIDLEVMATVNEEEVRQNVERVRAVSETVPIGIFLLMGVGDDPMVAAMKAALGGGYLSRFFGEATEVREALAELETMDIDRVQLTEAMPGAHDVLAPLLF